MEPLETSSETICDRCADDLLVIIDRNVLTHINITDTIAKAVDQNIEVVVVNDAGDRDDGSFDTELFLKLCCILLESEHCLLKLIDRCRNFKSEEIEPLLINIAHVISYSLNSCLP